MPAEGSRLPCGALYPRALTRRPEVGYGPRPMSGTESKSRYKDTVSLPETPFPMRGDLPQREPQILASWERSRLYERIQEARKSAPLFVLHDGPPYSNGHIHYGH